MAGMSSRERMLTALNRDQPDVPPCCFMLFNALKPECRDYVEYVERQVAMGLDTYVEVSSRPPVLVNDHYDLHGLPVSHDPRVTIREWREERVGEPWPLLVKTYHTPAGVLRSEVRQTDDWRWGAHVPFLDDYLEPRSAKFLVTAPTDLDALRYLLVPLTHEEERAFREDARQVKALARKHDLLVTGGWGVGADLLGWIMGLENMMLAPYDQPEFLQALLDLIGRWNRQRMEVTLREGVDLYIRRAWYESCAFWTPANYRRFLYPVLEEEVRLAHQYDTKFGYIISADAMPLLDDFVALGIDVLIGVDPREWDLQATKAKLQGKICLWGGLNGPLTVEQGQQAEVRQAVRTALEILAPGGGFILSPVDNVRSEASSRWRENVHTLIDAWRALTSQ
ncbi:MAG: hypothetical protein JXA74_15895 [Anaerolineae bacterium]|nr:hypothetical protein [Anaerolineae bacterium]